MTKLTHLLQPVSTNQTFSGEDILSLILHNSETLFLLVDTSLQIAYINDFTRNKFEELLHVPVQNGTPITNAVPPERRKQLEKIYQSVFEGETITTDLSIPTPTGVRHFENTIKPARNHEGKIVAAMVTARDSTEDRNSLSQVKAFEERWRFALEGSNQGVWDWDIKTDEVYYSDAHKKLFGLRVNDNNTQYDWTSMVHPDDLQQFKKGISIHLSNPNPYYESTYRIKTDDENYRYVLARGMIIARDKEGKPLRMIGTHTDITQQVQTEKELKRTNERFAYAARASSEALWEWNVETGEVYVSETYTNLFGWAVDEHRRFDEWHDHIHPDDKAATIKDYYDTVDNREAGNWTREYRYLKSDGSYAYVLDKAIILRNDEGKALKVIGATQDVTNRKKIEEELRTSNERFELVSKATSDAIYDYNLQTRQLYWGEGLQKLFGFEPHEIPFEDWEKMIHPSEHDRVMKSLQDAMNSRKKRWQFEYRFRNKYGGYRFVLDRGFIIRDEAGETIRILGSMQDITESKQNERLLSLERSIFELSSNPNHDISFIVNRLLIGVEEILEESLTTVLLLKKGDVMEHLAAPSLPEAYAKSINGIKIGTDVGSCGTAMAKRQTVIVDDIETNELWKDYAHLALPFGIRSAWSLPIIHSSGNVMGSFAIYYKEVKSPSTAELNMLEKIRNILRILMEHYWSLNEIKVVNERFDIMMRATHDLVWDWDLETNHIYRNAIGVKKVYGIEQSDLLEGVFQWLDRIHPDDLERVKAVINKILQAKVEDTFDVEYRFLRDDGTYSYVYDRGMIIRNEEGRPLRMIGAAQDITERKKLEQELLQNELERQKAINQATVNTQEQERREIGKELHDNVNQVLTTTKLYLDLAQTNPELKDDLITKSTKNILSVINEIRQLSRSLMDPSIGDLGLIDSIHDLIENINLAQQLQVSLCANREMEELLDPNQKLTLFRIIQEALNNALRHARATAMEIEMSLRGNMVTVRIHDNGIGFNPLTVKKGIGLKNIQNRIYLINGSHSIESTPAGGCTIKISFPIINKH